MSNPSVCYLSSTDLTGNNFRIEDNLGEAVHIHYGRVRLALTIKEFQKFSDNILDAASELFASQGINLKEIDEESWKYEFLKNYRNKMKIEFKNISLDSLFMKESFVKERSIKRFIPLRESGYIKLLQGDRSDEKYYMEKGNMEPSREDKIKWIINKIRLEGYPFDNQYILVDSEGYILDGIKRASALYYLYGGKRDLCVVCAEYVKKRSLSDAMYEGEQRVSIWEKSRQSNDINAKGSEPVALKYGELIRFLKENDGLLFEVAKQKHLPNSALIVNSTMILRSGMLDNMRKRLNGSLYSDSPYKDYSFIYSTKKPMVIVTDEGMILLTEGMCCKSKYGKYVLPIDKYVRDKSLEHLIWDDKKKHYIADEMITLFTTIIEAMIENNRFYDEDKEQIINRMHLLHKEEMYKMLEKVFYSYTSELINALLKMEFDEALTMYERWDCY